MIAQVPKTAGLLQPPNHMPPSSAFNAYSFAPFPLWTAFRKVKYSLWANAMVSERTPHWAFQPLVYKMFYFFSSIFSYPGIVLFLRSSIAFPILLFFWNPQSSLQGTCSYFFTNFTPITPITFRNVCTGLSSQCEATWKSFTWPCLIIYKILNLLSPPPPGKIFIPLTEPCHFQGGSLCLFSLNE